MGCLQSEEISWPVSLCTLELDSSPSLGTSITRFGRPLQLDMSLDAISALGAFGCCMGLGVSKLQTGMMIFGTNKETTLHKRGKCCCFGSIDFVRSWFFDLLLCTSPDVLQLVLVVPKQILTSRRRILNNKDWCFVDDFVWDYMGVYWGSTLETLWRCIEGLPGVF